MPRIGSRRSRSRRSRSRRSTKKRKLNTFFKKMLKARRANAPSFSYKGKTYRQFLSKPPKNSGLPPYVYYAAR